MRLGLLLSLKLGCPSSGKLSKIGAAGIVAADMPALAKSP